MSETAVETFDLVEVNRETSLIEYDKELSEADIVDTAGRMADLDAEIDRIEAEKKVVLAGYAAKLKEKNAEIKRSLKIIKDGFETVEEDCTFEFLWDEGVVEYYSCNTGECVRTREITNEERQMKLFNDKDKENKKNRIEDAPICHMKPMTFNEESLDDDGITILAHWSCQHCSKTIEA